MSVDVEKSLQVVEYVRPALGTAHYKVEVHLGLHRFVHTAGELSKADAEQLVQEIKYELGQPSTS